VPRKRTRRELLATVHNDGGEHDRQHQEAMCSAERAAKSGGGMGLARNHAMCGGSATCKQWEGLSCTEVDSIIHSVERYERVYSEGANVGTNGDLPPGGPPGVGGVNPPAGSALSRASRGLFHRSAQPQPPATGLRPADMAIPSPSTRLNAHNSGFTPQQPQPGGRRVPPPSGAASVAAGGQYSAGGGKEKPVSFPGVDEDGHIKYKLGDGLEPGVTQPRGRYKILRSLGSGTYGKVVECWDRQAGAYCAVKVVRAVPKYRHAAKTEVSVLQDLQGDHRCVKMLRSFDYRGHICLVFELLGPNLYEIMRANAFKPFSIPEIRSLAGQVLEALCHSHGKGVIHTDVKPENVLFQEQLHKRRPASVAPGGRLLASPDTQVKLVDFGSAVYQHSRHASVVSTRHYRAPEIILKLGWSFPCDVWSIGCILFEMYTGEVLFGLLDEVDHLAMIERVIKPIPPNLIRTAIANGLSEGLFDKSQVDQYRLQWPAHDTGEAAKLAVSKARPLKEVIQDDLLLDLVLSMLEMDPMRRITAGDALRHPFFTGRKQQN